MKNKVVGIDVGGTTVKIGIFSDSGTLQQKWEIPTNKSDNGAHILSEIYQSLIHKGVNPLHVIGYGFGVPGPVVNNITLGCVNLGWGITDIKDIFGKYAEHSHIVVDNDANVAALGELSYGAGIGKSDLVMITLGTGIGGGIITAGKSVKGAFGAAGEIGHIVVKHGGRLCNCGTNGCLETVASASGIIHEFLTTKEELQLQSIVNENNVSARTIVDAARQGDSVSMIVIDRLAFYLGYACHIVSLATNPEMIVFGGGVSNAGEFLLDKIKQQFKQYHFSAVQNTEITKAMLGNDAGIYGAASLVIND